MRPPIIGKKIHDQAIDSLIDALEPVVDDDASFYVGYPVAATVDAAVTMPALLISARFGLVCFDVVPAARKEDLPTLRAQQRSVALPLKAKLLTNPDLAGEDDLAFKVNSITYALATDNSDELTQNRVVGTDGLEDALKRCEGFPPQLLVPINAAIERVANIRPKSKRTIATTPQSKGSILKKIENEIANLDSWQKAAAIETPDGPQRIRGLAGSGKTIVLALKAAYLHGEHPEWRIGVTFHTRALKQQFKNLIRRFYFDDYREEPDDEQLLIMHSFGSQYDNGIYAEICRAYGVQPRDFGYAKRAFGFNQAFKGICAELLPIVESDPKILFDAVLIDEAQDLPREFLRLAYLCTRDHRIVWAYDDLQNLGDYQMLSLRETFGEDKTGNPLVRLDNRPKQPRQDIILPKCYRNTPWALVTAHALGSGIYRSAKLVQHPDDPALWKDIGYEVVDGDLQLGSPVALRRSVDATPKFFFDLLKPEDAVQFHKFNDDRDQFLTIARMIKSDLTTGELYPHDIAVVFPNAIEAEKRGMAFRQYLSDEGIQAHLPGITSSRDAFIEEGKVAISGPYRAKGNEAPVVYVMDADYCAGGAELIKKRNILFTAITRSRGWVKVCGQGAAMQSLIDEFNRLKDNDFQLRFTMPNPIELQEMRTLYRDITADERKKADEFKRAFDRLAEVDTLTVLQTLPKDVRDRIIRTLKDADEL
ncbi:ATP-binding domain-containing protein [Burkholderia cenocepacia]|uniref:DEAD/DEAH box helicase n=1 Tax=Burkholderia cepacia complex TaxID=87882 RepID=UPI0009BC9A07|nr:MULTISPECIES: ATP-binding domain-containing protein [Burkholderia cepacia complex]MCF1367090.1 ATP-binding domain-containing protein [Burkholderia cenocepacia]MCF1384623.1 ATP-binding domain-containing protein [Burkholderia cenocepacia]